MLLEAIILVFVIWNVVIKFQRYRNLQDLKGKVVLITGGGGALGRLFALQFGSLGCKVVLWDIDKEHLEKNVEEVKKAGGEAYGYYCNVARRDEVYKLAKDVSTRVGRVDILVNNAGILLGKSFMDLTDEQIIRTMDVNTNAVFWTVRAFLPEMIKAGSGHLVTVSSSAGLVGVPSLSDYCASKFACLGFHQAIRLELVRMGLGDKILTTAVCPYFIDTRLVEGAKTRFNWLLPILQPEEVVVKVVRAVRSGEEVVILPGILWLIPVLSAILPLRVADQVSKILGVWESMDDLKKNKETEKKKL
eukprot:TRINITY_DN1991_c0_g1_i1.p1 TRINITY_DN1991_c0_g1~~TRINITY_DN1991_c0_g1_i1.p1  ORF type:complete len:304 (-),score=65.70 TRINITY_DN1991_c0_g1_i1:222-1133(-)